MDAAGKIDVVVIVDDDDADDANDVRFLGGNVGFIYTIS